MLKEITQKKKKVWGILLYYHSHTKIDVLIAFIFPLSWMLNTTVAECVVGPRQHAT